MNQNENQQLGIISIPMQKWTTVYEPAKGLHIGTIFPDLDLPFFMANDPYSGPPSLPNDKAAMLYKIDTVSFAIDDLILYLDTHENDQDALKLYHEQVASRKLLIKDFTNSYYPLTHDCVPDQSEGVQYFNWCAGPMPWEGACN